MATRNIVPRADGEGSLGTAVKNWLAAFIKTITAVTGNITNIISTAITTTNLTVSGTLTSSGASLNLTNDLSITKATPKVKLAGTEGSALDLSIRENAGMIELYAETAATVRTKWSGITGRRITPLIDASEIATDAITNVKIIDDAVTEAKIADGAVTADRIGALAVTEAKINTGAVTVNKLATNSVSYVKIAIGAVTQPKLSTKEVVALADAAATLTATQLLDSGIFTITPTAARQLTTDTGPNIISSAPGYTIGTWYEFTIINLGAFLITLAAGSGVTLVGLATVAATAGTAVTWKIRIDSASTVTIYRT